MYTKQQINELYERVVAAIDISEELFDKAESEYKSLGRWIDEKTPSYKIQIYPQGSFALGTVVKPYTDDDEYDLDLVCEFEERYNLSAKQLKVDVVKPLLMGYAKTATDIEEKRRCWKVEYLHIKGFHMDVIPAILNGQYILITDKDENALTYDYIGSNPKGYIDWFNSRKKLRCERIKERYILNESQRICCQAEVVELKEYHLKTPLQKAIQLLKRHRDIMFANDKTNSAPISIIITTLNIFDYPQLCGADMLLVLKTFDFAGAEHSVHALFW